MPSPKGLRKQNLSVNPFQEFLEYLLNIAKSYGRSKNPEAGI